MSRHPQGRFAPVAAAAQIHPFETTSSNATKSLAFWVQLERGVLGFHSTRFILPGTLTAADVGTQSSLVVFALQGP